MKREGITLIETLVSLMIVSILITVGLGLFRVSSVIVGKSRDKNVVYRISNFISYGKSYCFNKGLKGLLKIDSVNNKIILRENDTLKQVKSYVLPEGYSFLETFDMSISSNGIVSSNTINIKSKNNGYYKITVSVGVDYVNVYY